MTENVTKQIYYCTLKERTTYDLAVNAMENIAMHAGRNGYERLILPYMRTDMARNMAAQKFVQLAKNPDDTLVMLDGDHNHPGDIVGRLAAHDLPFVGALAFRRGEPYEPMMFMRGTDGGLHPIAEWEKGAVLPADMLGHAAIAIQKRVFDALKGIGVKWTWWQYEYPGGEMMPSEDMYFGKLMERLGQPMWCDTSIITPHLFLGQVDDAVWSEYLSDHPDMKSSVTELLRPTTQETETLQIPAMVTRLEI